MTTILKPRLQGKMIDNFNREVEDWCRLENKYAEHQRLADHYRDQAKAKEARVRQLSDDLEAQGIEPDWVQRA